MKYLISMAMAFASLGASAADRTTDYRSMHAAAVNTIHLLAAMDKKVEERKSKGARLDVALVATFSLKDNSHTNFGILVNTQNSGWKIIHVGHTERNLNKLYTTGVASFLLDQPDSNAFEVHIPSDEIQKRIVDVINATVVVEGDKVTWSLVPPKYNKNAKLKKANQGNSSTWILYVAAATKQREYNIDYNQANQLVRESALNLDAPLDPSSVIDFMSGQLMLEDSLIVNEDGSVDSGYYMYETIH